MNTRILAYITACTLVGTASIAAEEKAAEATTSTPTLNALTKEVSNFLILGAAVDVYSAYVWRGMTITDEPVWQPDVTFGFNFGDYGALTADVWGNFDMTSANEKRHCAGLNEIDYTLAYSIDVEDFSLSAGHIWYTFPQVSGDDMEYGSSTREFFAGASYNNDIVKPFIKAYYDYVLAEGAYVAFGLNKEVAVTDALAIGAEASLGMGSEHWVTTYHGANADSGLSDAAFTLYTAYSITENVSVGGRIVYSTLVDGNLREESGYRSEILWGGINLKVSL